MSAPLDDFFFSPDYRNLIGTNRAAETGVVVNLDVGREIAELPLPGMPHLGSGITWDRNGHRVMAAPHLTEAMISVIDMEDWSLIRTIPTDGPGFFLRSHENSPFVWADVFTGPHKDEMHIIDKETLEIVRTLNPAPGKTVAHTEFTRDGKHALVSVWEDDGAVIVYDADDLRRGDAAADEEAFGEIQCLEQDQLCRWHQPLNPGAGRSGNWACCFIPSRRPPWRSTCSCWRCWGGRSACPRCRPGWRWRFRGRWAFLRPGPAPSGCGG